MFQAHFAGMEWTGLPLFALFVFLTAFVLMLVRTYAWKARRDWDAVAALPLEDETTEQAHQREVKP